MSLETVEQNLKRIPHVDVAFARTQAGCYLPQIAKKAFMGKG